MNKTKELLRELQKLNIIERQANHLHVATLKLLMHLMNIHSHHTHHCQIKLSIKFEELFKSWHLTILCSHQKNFFLLCLLPLLVFQNIWWCNIS